MTTTRLSPVLEALKELRADEEMADVILVCDGGEIKAHRVILACRSIYFKKMFTGNFRESQTNRVELPSTNVDVMNSILDYIYFESLEKIEIQNLDQVLQIHQSSHFFAIADLTNHCWKLIMKSLDVQNLVDIWDAVLLYGEEQEIVAILQFVLKNIQTIIEKDKLLALKTSQYKQLLEEITKSNIVVNTTILAGILKWREINLSEDCNLEDFLLHLNYDHITKDYLKQLLENDTSLFTDKFCRQFTVSHMLSSSTKSELTSGVEQRTLSIKKKKSLKLLRFNYFLQLKNGYSFNQKALLKIVDLNNEVNDIIVSQLPFRIGDKNFVALEKGCNLYIFGCLPLMENNLNTSFFLYDWRTNTTSLKPPIPTPVRYPFYTAIVDDNIYIVEGAVLDPRVLHFSISQEKWTTIPCTLLQYVIGFANLGESLYFLCREASNNSHDLYKLINNAIEHVCNIPIPFCGDSIFLNYIWNTVYKKTVVHNNKLFIFILCNANDLRSYAIYNPENLQWEFKTLSYNFYVFNDFECFSNPDDSIYFYVYCTRKLYSFHENDDGSGSLKELMELKELLKDDESLKNIKYEKMEKLFVLQSDD